VSMCVQAGSGIAGLREGMVVCIGCRGGAFEMGTLP
jgi:hypothetical protein